MQFMFLKLWYFWERSVGVNIGYCHKHEITGRLPLPNKHTTVLYRYLFLAKSSHSNKSIWLQWAIPKPISNKKKPGVAHSHSLKNSLYPIAAIFEFSNLCTIWIFIFFLFLMVFQLQINIKFNSLLYQKPNIVIQLCWCTMRYLKRYHFGFVFGFLFSIEFFE